MKKIVGIYKITNPKGKVYIGQSVNIKKRWGDYKCLHNCKEQKMLYNSFIKYGVNNKGYLFSLFSSHLYSPLVV